MNEFSWSVDRFSCGLIGHLVPPVCDFLCGFQMRGGNPNQHLSSPIFEPIETMNGEGAPEFVIDPALYFSAATNYGYYCTGFESPSEWDDHHRIIGLDGADVQYAGTQTDNLPYVYYTPTYGYGESPFNPYNPYIPGAMIGVDGSYVGTQYYAISPYQNPVSSGYFPIAVQTKPDAVASSSVEPLFDTASSATNRVSSSETRHSQSSSSMAFTKNPSKVYSSHSHSLGKMSEGLRANSGASQRYSAYRGSAVGNHGSSSFVPQPQNGNNITSHGREFAQQNNLKVPLIGGSFSDSVSSADRRAVGDGAWSKFYQRSAVDDTSRGPDSLAEQNRGPRTNRSKNQFVVKAYTKKAGACDPQGNIVISADDYNRDDFPLDYVHAKFFVIKSYSEDDVHKSIKYNVWSSTPNGNKKLNSAYEDAQLLAAGKPRGCPIFLYFSVNASGQFCGVAEMVGAVDFQKDMDFWQQDKWSGSFPVKWHMIKDVPNMNFRHIILENNEHKPVTNSRDTQEIMYKLGMEMLKIFKNSTPKTSLLDDFLYYENRQKIMLEERARLLPKPIAPSFQPVGEVGVINEAAQGTEQTPAPAFVGPGKMMEQTTGKTSLSTKVNDYSADSDSAKKKNEFTSAFVSSGKITEQRMGQISLITKVNDSSADSDSRQNEVKLHTNDIVSTLKIGSPTINPKQTICNPLVVATSHSPATMKVTTGPADVVTVGSVPVKVNGHNISRTSGLLTVGTILLEPKLLRQEKADVKDGSVPK